MTGGATGIGAAEALIEARPGRGAVAGRKRRACIREWSRWSRRHRVDECFSRTADGCDINHNAPRAAARRHSVVSTNKSSKYILPNGFFFDYVLCPNYLGEFIEWLGLAVAVNNLALRAFALWTFANLFPRAVNYRRWYVDTFGEKAVGKHRKAFLPFLV